MLAITPEQLCSAGGYISREWGDYGYSIEKIESPTHRVSLFHVCASDGARFVVAADRYGNCRYADEAELNRVCLEIVPEMHAAADPNA